MAGFGYDAVMDMPWTEAREFAACVADDRQRRWVDMATAMRVAGAEQTAWDKIMREMGA